MTDMGNKVLVSVAPVAATDKVIIPEKIVIKQGRPWCICM